MNVTKVGNTNDMKQKIQSMKPFSALRSYEATYPTFNVSTNRENDYSVSMVALVTRYRVCKCDCSSKSIWRALSCLIWQTWQVLQEGNGFSVRCLMMTLDLIWEIKIKASSTSVLPTKYLDLLYKYIHCLWLRWWDPARMDTRLSTKIKKARTSRIMNRPDPRYTGSQINYNSADMTSQSSYSSASVPSQRSYNFSRNAYNYVSMPSQTSYKSAIPVLRIFDIYTQAWYLIIGSIQTPWTYRTNIVIGSDYEKATKRVETVRRSKWQELSSDNPWTSYRSTDFGDTDFSSRNPKCTY